MSFFSFFFRVLCTLRRDEMVHRGGSRFSFFFEKKKQFFGLGVEFPQDVVESRKKNGVHILPFVASFIYDVRLVCGSTAGTR